MVRFSKFGLGSLISGIVICVLMLQFVYGGFSTDALVAFVVDLLKGAVDWAGVGLIIAGILLFVL